MGVEIDEDLGIGIGAEVSISEVAWDFENSVVF